MHPFINAVIATGLITSTFLDSHNGQVPTEHAIFYGIHISTIGFVGYVLLLAITMVMTLYEKPNPLLNFLYNTGVITAMAFTFIWLIPQSLGHGLPSPFCPIVWIISLVLFGDVMRTHILERSVPQPTP